MSSIETPDETLPVEWRARSSLLPNDWNPNAMTEEKREELVFSIQDNGWTQPIVVKEGTDEIIDGEQRWHAAGDSRVKANEDLTPDGIDAGYVPVFTIDVDETQARVATMQHNIDGETDSAALGDIFADLDDDGLFYQTAERFQIGETGIDRLIERADSADVTPDAFDEDPDALEADVFSESMEFQMTGEEAALVQALLDDVGLVDLCRWAISSSTHSQTRVDMRLLGDRSAEYTPDEDVIEYPSVDTETHLSEFYRDSDPEEVTADE